MEKKIARPDAPNHYMVLRPVERRIVVRLPDGPKLAETTNAVRLMEHGRSLYDPVIYLPMDDVIIPLQKQEKSTHCPLKGDACYFSLNHEGVTLTDLAWSYPTPLDFSSDIAGLIAFYGDKVVLEEHPL